VGHKELEAVDELVLMPVHLTSAKMQSELVVVVAAVFVDVVVLPGLDY